MMHFVLACIVAGIPLCLAEILLRSQRMPAEYSRKLVHVGSCAAVLVLLSFCSLREIAAVAGLFTVILSAGRATSFWRSLYGIERRSFGELFFPLGVGVAALAAPSIRSFAAAMLILGISDTLAALVGQRYGSPGHRLPGAGAKTLVGSAVFCASAAAIMLACGVYGFWYVPVAALATTVVELYSPRGSDKQTIPMAVVGLARLL
jgi:dolichol kinase